MSWEDLGWERCREHVDESTIAAFEERIGRRFPRSYRECVMACHAGTPTKNAFDVLDPEIGVVTTGLGMMLSFDESDDESVVAAAQALSDRLPEGVVPFAVEAGGDYLCFDYRSVEAGEPAVVYWSHEKDPESAITPLANDFDSFMVILRDP